MSELEFIRINAEEQLNKARIALIKLTQQFQNTQDFEISDKLQQLHNQVGEMEHYVSNLQYYKHIQE